MNCPLVDRPVWHAPTRGRCYLTKKAAYRAEAKARFWRKYREHAEEWGAGWELWSVAMIERYARLLQRADERKLHP